VSWRQKNRAVSHQPTLRQLFELLSKHLRLYNPKKSTFYNCACSFNKMAVLSPAGQDRLFFFGIGFTTVAVVGLMRHLLTKYRDLAVEPPVENKPQYITQEVEDSLKLSTLDKLLDSPNFCIQETAAIIICERALHDKSTIDTLLWFITQPDHDTRERGVRTLTMMMNPSKFENDTLRDYLADLVTQLLSVSSMSPPRTPLS